MRPVFLDASGLIAKVNSRDNWHRPAQAAWDELLRAGVQLATTSLILIELGDGLSRVHFRQLAVDIRSRLLNSERVDVVQTTIEDERRGWQLFEEHRDKEWGVTDCVSMNVMRRYGIVHVFSADRHFEQAGFTLLLNR